MTGNDVLFGEGQDDDIIGGYGNDWISGGTGDDGVIGDDGRISTSRNSSRRLHVEQRDRRVGPVVHRQRRRHLPRRAAERRRRAARDRSGHARANGNVLNEFIYTPGQIQTATINVARRAQQVDQPDAVQRRPDRRRPLFDANGYDDIIFGGLGNDFLHGGSGDDAISGAEALPTSYVQLYSNNTTCGQENNDCVIGLVLLDYGHPWNVGDTLHFGADTNPWHSNGHVADRLGEFLLYDEYDPRRAILFQRERHAVELPGDARRAATPAPTPAAPRPTSRAVLPQLGRRNEGPADQRLRRDVAERQHLPRRRASRTTTATTSSSATSATTGSSAAPATTPSGAAGATTSSTPTTSSRPAASTTRPGGKCGSPSDTWLNDTPDTHPTYEDRVYGGAGLDILIGNTGGDRLIDWVGEFNSYLVPFAPFGIATVSRQVPPALFEFLYALSKAQGADPTRAADDGASRRRARNGEPNGEIGLVTQKDHGLWQQQTGSPTDPQAGNIPGGRRDVLRTANFNDGTTTGFAPDSGVWQVDRRHAAGRRRPRSARTRPPSSTSTRRCRSTTRSSPQVLVQKPTAGWNGERVRHLRLLLADRLQVRRASTSALNKAVLGHRDGAGLGHRRDRRRHTATSQSDTYYDMQVVVNGLVVTVLVNGVAVLTKQLDPRYIDGAAVRPQQGPRRRRLEQLARHLRQLHRPGAAAAVHLREHRGLRRRRRRPLHRRSDRHVGRHARGR